MNRADQVHAGLADHLDICEYRIYMYAMRGSLGTVLAKGGNVGDGRLRAEVRLRRQTSRLFRELVQVLCKSRLHEDREPELSSAETWWRMLADISGLAVAPDQPDRAHTRNVAFRFDPTPAGLEELSRTIDDLAGREPFLTHVDRLALATLREVESRLTGDGLRTTHAAVRRSVRGARGDA